MARHNLSTVILFEFGRTVRKGRFWAATLSVPVVVAIVFALVYISTTSREANEEAQARAEISFAYTDGSGLVTPELAAALGGAPADDPTAATEAVKAGELDAYFSYAAAPEVEPIRVVGADRGIFDNGAYDAVAKSLLAAAAQQRIGDPTVSAAARGDVETEATIYRGGKPTGGVSDAVAPLMLLAVFFLTLMLLSNQMLNSTLEEKENRVTEMLLTTVNPSTLIIGKIIALFMVGAVQILVFIAPVAAAYALARERLAFPEFDLSELRFGPGPMITGTLLLIGGFVLFTGVLVSIGAVMPTAKDAGVVFGPLIALMFVPLYAIGLIVTDPESLIVQVFTYFPLSAPATAMLRNGFGTLSPPAAAFVIAELFVLGAVVLRLAVYLFRYGSIAYSSRLNLRTALDPRTLLNRRPPAPGA